MQAAIYTRISRDRLDDKLGVSRQLEDCVALAERRGWSDPIEFQDNDTSASGKAKRPGFDALLQAVEHQGVTVIIAWSLDRLTRNRRDTVKLIEICMARSVTIALARGSDLDMSTPMGRMMADTLANLARYEIEVSSDRHIRANEQAARAGKPWGGQRPWGYQADRMTIDEAQASIIREIARRTIAGQSYREIAWWLNEEGIRAPKGGLWYGIGVQHMMINKRLAGIRIYKGAEYKGAWPPILDADTWEQLQLEVRLRKVRNAQAPKARKYLLTGLVYCGLCGSAMIGDSTRDRTAVPVLPKYCCRAVTNFSRQGGCGRLQRHAAALDAWVAECVFHRLDTPALATLISDSSDAPQVRELLEARQTVTSRIDGFAADYGAGLLTRTMLSTAKAVAEAELKDVNRKLTKLQRCHASVEIPIGQSLRTTWEAETDDWRRRLLHLVVKKIVVNPTKDSPPVTTINGKTYKFDPNRVEIFWNS